METIYCISGLGADKRAYERLIFPANYVVKHIDWIVPYQNETLEKYTERLIVDFNVVNSTIIGLSFGGIIAHTIASQKLCKQVILISSVKSIDGIPKIRKLLRVLPFYKVLPEIFFHKTNFIVNWLFGVKGIQARKLLKSIFELSDYRFVIWAINQIIWLDELPKIKSPFYQIHGSKDKLFPIELQNADFIVSGGGHFTIYENAENISETLAIILKKSNLSS